MAPENVRDARSDIFALGRILEDLTPHPKPRPLAAIAARASHADPRRRYPTVAQLSGDVTRFLDGLPVHAYRETLAERLSRFVRRNQVLLLLLASYLVVKVALFFWSLR